LHATNVVRADTHCIHAHLLGSSNVPGRDDRSHRGREKSCLLKRCVRGGNRTTAAGGPSRCLQAKAAGASGFLYGVRPNSRFRFRDRRAGEPFSGIACPLAGEHQVDTPWPQPGRLDTPGSAPAGSPNAWPDGSNNISPTPILSLIERNTPGARPWRVFKLYYPDRRLGCFCRAARHAGDEMGTIMFPSRHELILTAADSPRALSPEELATVAAAARTQPTSAAALDWSPEAAAELLSRSSPGRYFWWRSPGPSYI